MVFESPPCLRREIDGTLAINAHNVELPRVGVFRFADIGHANRRLAHYLQRRLIHVVQFELAVGVNVVVVMSDFDVSRGQHDIGLIDGPHHIHRAQLAGFQLVGVNVEHDLPPSSAKRLRNGSARHAGELVANEVLREILQSGFTQPVAFQRDQADRQTGGIELQHDRRQCSRRQIPHVGHRQVGDRGC